MQEDLDFTGNQYNTLLSMFTAGYVIGYAMPFIGTATSFHSHLLVQSISRHFAHGQNFSIHLAAILCVSFTCVHRRPFGLTGDIGEILWTVLVMCCSVAKNVETLYALRFFIGMAEVCSPYLSFLCF